MNPENHEELVVTDNLEHVNPLLPVMPNSGQHGFNPFALTSVTLFRCVTCHLRITIFGCTREEKQLQENKVRKLFNLCCNNSV